MEIFIVPLEGNNRSSFVTSAVRFTFTILSLGAVFFVFFDLPPTVLFLRGVVSLLVVFVSVSAAGSSSGDSSPFSGDSSPSSGDSSFSDASSSLPASPSSLSSVSFFGSSSESVVSALSSSFWESSSIVSSLLSSSSDSYVRVGGKKRWKNWKKKKMHRESNSC